MTDFLPLASRVTWLAEICNSGNEPEIYDYAEP